MFENILQNNKYSFKFKMFVYLLKFVTKQKQLFENYS